MLFFSHFLDYTFIIAWEKSHGQAALFESKQNKLKQKNNCWQHPDILSSDSDHWKIRGVE